MASVGSTTVDEPAAYLWGAGDDHYAGDDRIWAIEPTPGGFVAAGSCGIFKECVRLCRRVWLARTHRRSAGRYPYLNLHFESQDTSEGTWLCLKDGQACTRCDDSFVAEWSVTATGLQPVWLRYLYCGQFTHASVFGLHDYDHLPAGDSVSACRLGHADVRGSRVASLAVGNGYVYASGSSPFDPTEWTFVFGFPSLDDIWASDFEDAARRRSFLSAVHHGRTFCLLATTSSLGNTRVRCVPAMYPTKKDGWAYVGGGDRSEGGPVQVTDDGGVLFGARFWGRYGHRSSSMFTPWLMPATLLARGASDGCVSLFTAAGDLLWMLHVYGDAGQHSVLSGVGAVDGVLFVAGSFVGTVHVSWLLWGDTAEREPLVLATSPAKTTSLVVFAIRLSGPSPRCRRAGGAVLTMHAV